MEYVYRLISSLDEISDFQNDLYSCDEIGLDTESNGLDYFKDTLLLVQACINDHVYIFDVVGLGKENLTTIISLIEASTKNCIGHNIKYDLKVLKTNTGILLQNVFDTMVIEGVLTAGLGKFYPSLTKLLDQYLEIVLDKDTREEFIGAYAVTQEMLLYAALDVKYLIPLKNKMVEALAADNLLRVADLENKLVPEVAAMELEGVLINEKLWTRLTNKAIERAEQFKAEVLEESLKDIQPQLVDKTAFEMCELIGTQTGKKAEKDFLKSISEFDYAFPEFKNRININSPAQLLKLLHLNKIPVTNTNSKDLEKIKGQYNLVDKILEFRPYSKRVSSFGEDFVQRVHPLTKRLHSNFNQLGTATGRWSSDHPNLQQIPKESDDEDSKYRSCFLARPGYKILTVDYNQAELRLLGAVAGETEFIKAYNEGIDLHSLTGSHIFHIPLEKVTKTKRWIAKQVNFAVVYGSSAYGLYYNFDIPVEEGEAHLSNYFKAYPRIKVFMEYAGNIIWDRKYSITPYGRKRFFEDKKIFEDYKEDKETFKELKLKIWQE